MNLKTRLAQRLPLPRMLLGAMAVSAAGFLMLPKLSTSPLAAEPEVVVLTAQGETEPVESRGDAADDAAIWYNATSPEQSRVLGTDKRRGLEVYDLAGQRLQSLPVGRLNNVDLRQDVPMNGRRMDLAVATHRDLEGLSVFEIAADGQVTLIGTVSTALLEIYGVCLYRHVDELHVFVNAKDGRYLQYRLELIEGNPVIVPLRFFRLGSQPEGCVADDNHARLFVGEEDVGVWVMRASPEVGTDRELVIAARDPLEPDIEGLALYNDEYLVVSSQGNDRFAVLDTEPPFRLMGIFRVDKDDASGIGAVRDTDGIAISAHNFGTGFEQGLMVVQDGNNRPDNQNFKYLDWSRIATALGLHDQR
ncbi:phytase [Halomonas sp. HK25]|uniref:phytase n=1 Tax=Halomonas sp. HK25 TaxID=3394321 RepID=UPI0039FD67BD